MSNVIIYGLGGFCADCNDSHDHPLNNIVDQYYIDDPEATPEQTVKESALAKLSALGLTPEEVSALLGTNE
jgi:hypothetical protein